MIIKKLKLLFICIIFNAQFSFGYNNPLLYIKNIPKKIAAHLSEKQIQKAIYLTPLLSSSYCYFLINHKNKSTIKSLFHSSLFYLLLNTIIYKILNLKKENLAEEYFFHIDKYQNFIQLYQLINLQYFAITEKCHHLLDHTPVTHIISPSQQVKLVELSSNFDPIFNTTQQLLSIHTTIYSTDQLLDETTILEISHNVEDLMLNAYIEFANIMKTLIKNINEAQNNYCR